MKTAEVLCGKVFSLGFAVRTGVIWHFSNLLLRCRYDSCSHNPLSGISTSKIMFDLKDRIRIRLILHVCFSFHIYKTWNIRKY